MQPYLSPNGNRTRSFVRFEEVKGKKENQLASESPRKPLSTISERPIGKSPCCLRTVHYHLPR